MVNTNVNELATALADLSPAIARRGPRCSVSVILDSLDPTVRAILQTKMANAAIASSQIATTLTACGYPVKGTTVARHRRAGSATGCLCEPVAP